MVQLYVAQRAAVGVAAHNQPVATQFTSRETQIPKSIQRQEKKKKYDITPEKCIHFHFICCTLLISLVLFFLFLECFLSEYFWFSLLLLLLSCCCCIPLLRLLLIVVVVAAVVLQVLFLAKISVAVLTIICYCCCFCNIFAFLRNLLGVFLLLFSFSSLISTTSYFNFCNSLKSIKRMFVCVWWTKAEITKEDIVYKVITTTNK